MDPNELMRIVRAQPFRPFTLRLTDGREYEIRYPKTIKPTQYAVLLFFPLDLEDGVYDDWEMINPTAIAEVKYAAA